MATASFDVQPLFAEPYFRADISDAISESQVQFIKNLEMIPNKTNLISENLYIFEAPELKSIKDAVHQALDAYAKNVMGISQQIYVTQSWSLVNPPNVGMHGHTHSNSIVSGSLYYCDMPEPIARMIFDRYKTYRQLELNPDEDKQNLYNTPMNIITPKKGEVILFSSDLQHFVETNTSSEPRYSIAFNTFVKGRLGSYRDVSELTL